MKQLVQGKLPANSVINNHWGEVPLELRRLNMTEEKMIALYNLGCQPCAQGRQGGQP